MRELVGRRRLCAWLLGVRRSQCALQRRVCGRERTACCSGHGGLTSPAQLPQPRPRALRPTGRAPAAAAARRLAARRRWCLQGATGAQGLLEGAGSDRGCAAGAQGRGTGPALASMAASIGAGLPDAGLGRCRAMAGCGLPIGRGAGRARDVQRVPAWVCWCGLPGCPSAFSLPAAALVYPALPRPTHRHSPSTHQPASPNAGPGLLATLLARHQLQTPGAPPSRPAACPERLQPRGGAPGAPRPRPNTARLITRRRRPACRPEAAAARQQRWGGPGRRGGWAAAPPRGLVSAGAPGAARARPDTQPRPQHAVGRHGSRAAARDTSGGA